MSGLKKGGQPYLKLTKKKIEHIAPGKVKAERDVLADTPLPRQPLTLKLGLRIKQGQQIDTFEVRAKKNKQLLAMARQPAGDPIAQDLAATLGLANDEQWATYLVSYDPNAHKKNFDTTLVLSNFQIPDNGFQIVTVALVHDNQTFANGSYGFGVSLIPGKNNTGWAMPFGVGQAKPPAAKGLKGAPSKAKSPASKKKSKRKKR